VCLSSAAQYGKSGAGSDAGTVSTVRVSEFVDKKAVARMYLVELAVVQQNAA
jgi:hypothetical protein